MKKNIGNGDRFLRIIIGIILLTLVLGDVFQDIMMWIAVLIGLFLVITSSAQVCILYSVFGINTCKIIPKKRKKRISKRFTDF